MQAPIAALGYAGVNSAGNPFTVLADKGPDPCALRVGPALMLAIGERRQSYGQNGQTDKNGAQTHVDRPFAEREPAAPESKRGEALEFRRDLRDRLRLAAVRPHVHGRGIIARPAL
jgi:hypothetical protein